ncbi:MAG: TOBE domain-containing protein, partial [Lachnospiraceae bacterium]|nr:TOBE domain-containing protein [Lachnospiraceae bacterium]
VGTPNELYFNQSNMFVAGFIWEPPMNFIAGRLKGGKINVGATQLDLGMVADKNVLDKYEGSEIAFGFRPEAIKLVGKEDVQNAYRLTGEVELTELLGDNTNVYMDIQDVKSILKVDPHDTPEMDSKLEFAIPYESVYLFDKQTEKRIKLRETSK